MAAPAFSCAQSQAAAPVIVVVDSGRFELSGAIGERSRIEFREAARQRHLITLGGQAWMIEPGEARVIVLDLEPGAYELHCVTHGARRSVRLGLER